MTEQERELFERRSLELAQARRVIDDLRERYTDVSKALSHVLHDNASLEAERDAALNAQEAAEKEVFALREQVAGWHRELTKAIGADAGWTFAELIGGVRAQMAAGEASDKEVFALRAKLREATLPPGIATISGQVLVKVVAGEPRLKSASPGDVFVVRSNNVAHGDLLLEVQRPARLETPTIDESGEPAAYDVGMPSEQTQVLTRGMTPDDVDRAMHERSWRFRRWTPEAPVEPKAEDTRPPGERVKVGDRVRVVWTEQRYERVGKVVCIDETRWPIEVMFDDSGKVGALRRDEILEILPESP